jgi:hypothetical protein
MKFKTNKIQLSNLQLEELPLFFKRIQYNRMANIEEEMKLMYYNSHLDSSEMRNAIPIRKICKISSE